MARERVLRYRTCAPRFRVSITTHDGLQSCGWLLCRLRSGLALQSFLQAFGLDSYQCLYEAHYHGKVAGPIQATDLANLGHRHVDHGLTITYITTTRLCHDIHIGGKRQSGPALHCNVALTYASFYLSTMYLLRYLDLAPLTGITCNIYSQPAAWNFCLSTSTRSYLLSNGLTSFPGVRHDGLFGVRAECCALLPAMSGFYLSELSHSLKS